VDVLVRCAWSACRRTAIASGTWTCQARATLATIAILAALALCVGTPALAASVYQQASSLSLPGSPAGVAVDLTTGDGFVVAGGVVQTVAPVDRLEPSAGYSLGTPIAGSTGAFQVAVDNTCYLMKLNNSECALFDTSNGDLYTSDFEAGIIQKFTDEGKPGNPPQLGAGASPQALLHPYGVAVDPASGDLYVSDTEHNIVDVYEPSGKFVLQFATGSEPTALAFNSTGSGLYLIVSGKVEELNGNGDPVLQTSGPNAGTNIVYASNNANAIAVDQSTNIVYVVEGEGNVAVFGSSGASLDPPTFSGGGPFSFGAAVDAASHAIIISDYFGERLDIFQSVLVPQVTTGPALVGGEAKETLEGEVNPEGVAVTSCKFEYGIASVSEHSQPCIALPGEGNAFVPVQANIGGLQPAASYHYRLVAATKEDTEEGVSSIGRELEFKTLSKPIIDAQAFSEVGFTTAVLSAELNTTGLPVTYYFEYGVNEVSEERTAPSSLGGGSGDLLARAELRGLRPDTTYRFRVVAESKLGASKGAPSITFTTFPLEANILPDGRVPEMVTPVTNYEADVYAPAAQGSLSEGGARDFSSALPFRAAAAGGAVAYVGQATVDGISLENEYLATRDPFGGWEQVDISPSGYERAAYEAFFSDLSTGFLASSSETGLERGLPPLDPGAPSGYQVLYSRTDSSNDYRALFTTKPPNRSIEEFGSANVAGHTGPVLYAGAASDHEDLLFEANDALAINAVDGGKTENNLYESVDGQLTAVNIPPGAGKSVPNATFGSPEGDTNEEPDFSNVISTDGSRVFWSELESASHDVPKALYVREDGTTTVQIDLPQGGPDPGGGGRFWTASSDGTKVFFTDCHRLTGQSTAVPNTNCRTEDGPVGQDLYEYEVNPVVGQPGVLRDLTIDNDAKNPLGADVQGVLGASADGDYVYFIADGVLTETPNSLGESATLGDCNSGEAEDHVCNLYLLHAGATKFIARLSQNDNQLSFDRQYGDWKPGLGDRTSEITPNGYDIVFMSKRSLTGYPSASQLSDEVFIYDADTNGLICASCNPSGESPSAAIAKGQTADLPNSNQATYMPRLISEDGGRVFFDSFQALVPGDTNGTQDVYEWEREGEGGCATAKVNGCVYLLSGGDSTDASFLLDASASGDEVFLVSRAQLTPEDRNSAFNVFDDRVGGTQPLVPPACAGTGCQGLPTPPPIFSTPASATFNGVGNFPPPPPAKGKEKRIHKKSEKKSRKKVQKSVKRRVKGKARRLGRVGRKQVAYKHGRGSRL
jgi:DNA-binding beta-propeller fold protein YncE